MIKKWHVARSNVVYRNANLCFYSIYNVVAMPWSVVVVPWSVVVVPWSVVVVPWSVVVVPWSVVVVPWSVIVVSWSVVHNIYIKTCLTFILHTTLNIS
jgi:hypothetical protein